jgi:ABC-type dipeptide/oligopeptide/nickel transport system permease component
VLGLDIWVLLGGAIPTEFVVDIPRIGRLADGAIGDLPFVQGTVLLRAFFIIVMNLTIDVQ